MTALTARTKVSDTYPAPNNADARAGLGNLYDVLKEFLEGAQIDVASASTVNIGGQTTCKLNITGTTTITSFGTTYRGPIFIRFDGALTLTHNATTLILPGGANITTVAGDTCIAVPNSGTSGTADGWLVMAYQRSTQTGTFTPGVSFGGGTTGITYATQYGQWARTGNVVQVTGYLQLSNKGSSTGQAKLTGLPFQPRDISGGGIPVPGSIYAFSAITYTGMMTIAAAGPGSTDVNISQTTEAGTQSLLTHSNFANNSLIAFALTYAIAA